MKGWQASALAFILPTMNNKRRINNSEVRAEQVTNQPPQDVIYLGCDLHKQWVVVTRIIDHSTPQPAQRFTWEQFWSFAQKQTTLGKQVHAVYEAGAFGFWPARKLKELGVKCVVVHPEKLDPHHKRVQTDSRDSRQLADKLQRYVLGNRRALVAVYIPTEKEEQQRIQSRHRRVLARQLSSLRARGRGLLLSQGVFHTHGWWKEARLAELKPRLGEQLHAALESTRKLLEAVEEQLQEVENKLEAAAPKTLPLGLGRLTFVLLQRELCNYQRFGNRRAVGGFTGLCGAVSSSGRYHLDLSISKAGNPELRTLLVELAWRMTYWQPEYSGLKAWRRAGGAPAHKSRRKSAIVAVARQLAVDLWRWQTGRVTPEQLGWKMSTRA